MTAGERSTDVIVIGAGPAGLTAAITLARSGVRCLLVERPGLLDSYESERRPVVEHNMARSIDPEGSRRQARQGVGVDLAGRIGHHWTVGTGGRQASTLDLVDAHSLTLFTGPDGGSWPAAAATTRRGIPITVRTLNASSAIGLGVGRRGAILVRPDSVPLWLTTEPTGPAQLAHVVDAYFQLPVAAGALPARANGHGDSVRAQRNSCLSC